MLLSDQTIENAGNLWVWPGTHRANSDYFREQGIEKLIETRGYTPIVHPAPRQIVGKAGDLLLQQYLLGHNMGGNDSPIVRRALYFRLMRVGHLARWRECLQDPLLEFDAVRSAVT